jgi:hypothetical protein
MCLHCCLYLSGVQTMAGTGFWSALFTCGVSLLEMLSDGQIPFMMFMAVCYQAAVF